MAELTDNASTPDCIFGTKAGSNNCKSDATMSAGASPLCPRCGSKKLWRDAKRYTAFGDEIQRWHCRDCNLRFSDPTDLQNSWSNKEKNKRLQEPNELKTANGILYS